MPNRVIVTPLFEKKFKRFSKKFPSLYNEIEILENALIQNPALGDPLGANLYKVRLASEDKGKGKSGGFRIITYLIKETSDSTDIFLITIYDKSEESTISKTVLINLVKSIFED
jgi:mRNA-degrading endonuclease RelE of RelBE toxin-antitoxin system